MAKKSKGAMPAMPHGHDDYMAENDLRTLIEAEKIKRNPERMRCCMKKKREMDKHLAGIGSKR